MFKWIETLADWRLERGKDAHKKEYLSGLSYQMKRHLPALGQLYYTVEDLFSYRGEGRSQTLLEDTAFQVAELHDRARRNALPFTTSSHAWELLGERDGIIQAYKLAWGSDAERAILQGGKRYLLEQEPTYDLHHFLETGELTPNHTDC